jgi:hypothetical protein
MEPALGHDFSKVRVHDDARAGASALAVNALAYAVGSDVVFAPGRYAPGTEEGRRVLAHELIHTAQGGEASSGPIVIGGRDDPAEVEAARGVDLVRRGFASPSGSAVSGSATLLRRQEASPGSERPCAGWEGDRQSISKATADHYVRTEVDPNIVPMARRIWCSTDPFCIVYYTEDLAVFVSTAQVPKYMIAVRYPGSPDRPPTALPSPRCEYEYECPGGQIKFTNKRCSK